MEEEVDSVMSGFEVIIDPIVALLRQYSTIIFWGIIGYFIGDYMWKKYRKQSSENDTKEQVDSP